MEAISIKLKKIWVVLWSHLTEKVTESSCIVKSISNDNNKAQKKVNERKKERNKGKRQYGKNKLTEKYLINANCFEFCLRHKYKVDCKVYIFFLFELW